MTLRKVAWEEMEFVESKSEDKPLFTGTVRTADSVARPEIFPATMRSPGAFPGHAQRECLSEDTLLDYVAGRCKDAQLSVISAHLDDCESCQDLLDFWLREIQSSQPQSNGHCPVGLTTFTNGFVVNNRYAINGFVGRGGMGEVYEAFDQLMGSRVALKTLPCTSGDNRHAIRRLREEVRNALRVGHRHVCRINELQEHHFGDRANSSVPFFTMEFVDGERLGPYMRRGQLPLAEIRVIAQQLLEGLSAAHTQKILHLDFKSDNVMLRQGVPTPNVVIMDFGLSRAFDSESLEQTSERLQLAGTLPYMPVEQLECQRNLRPAADIYSFGVVLYEMLTGQLPFRAQSLCAMLVKQLRGRPPVPSRLRPEIASAVDDFVMKCLRVDPDKRFANAGIAEQALLTIPRWQRGPTVRFNRLQWLIALCAAGFAVLCALYVAGSPPMVETTIQSIRPAARTEPLNRRGPPPPSNTPEGERRFKTPTVETPKPAQRPAQQPSTPPSTLPKTRPSGNELSQEPSRLADSSQGTSKSSAQPRVPQSTRRTLPRSNSPDGAHRLKKFRKHLLPPFHKGRRPGNARQEHQL